MQLTFRIAVLTFRTKETTFCELGLACFNNEFETPNKKELLILVSISDMFWIKEREQL